MTFHENDPHLRALREAAIAARQEYTYGASDEGWLFGAAVEKAYRRAVKATKAYEAAIAAAMVAGGVGHCIPAERSALTGWGPLRVAGPFCQARIIP